MTSPEWHWGNANVGKSACRLQTHTCSRLISRLIDNVTNYIRNDWRSTIFCLLRRRTKIKSRVDLSRVPFKLWRAAWCVDWETESCWMWRHSFHFTSECYVVAVFSSSASWSDCRKPSKFANVRVDYCVCFLPKFATHMSWFARKWL